MDCLVTYEWPGNVRELQNVVERAVILAHDRLIGPDLILVRSPTGPVDAPAITARATEPSLERPAERPQLTSGAVPFSEAERRAILRALSLTGWRISGRGGAAEVLGLKPTTLHAKM